MIFVHSPPPPVPGVNLSSSQLTHAVQSPASLCGPEQCFLLRAWFLLVNCRTAATLLPSILRVSGPPSLFSASQKITQDSLPGVIVQVWWFRSAWSSSGKERAAHHPHSLWDVVSLHGRVNLGSISASSLLHFLSIYSHWSSLDAEPRAHPSSLHCALVIASCLCQSISPTADRSIYHVTPFIHIQQASFQLDNFPLGRAQGVLLRFPLRPRAPVLPLPAFFWVSLSKGQSAYGKVYVHDFIRICPKLWGYSQKMLVPLGRPWSVSNVVWGFEGQILLNSCLVRRISSNLSLRPEKLVVPKVWAFKINSFPFQKAHKSWST